jgi:glycine dehydrogenase subunit 2
MEATQSLIRKEKLIFERSSPGRSAYSLPALDVPRKDTEKLIQKKYLRKKLEGVPEVSEVELVRHFTRLSTWNYGVDTGFYPLGSCTMKYNPKVNELVSRLERFAGSHPYSPPVLCQGSLRLIRELEEFLNQITGLSRTTLQPAAGAHGELTGMMIIKAYHNDKGDKARTKVLIPDSAHGTNPASATLCGLESVEIKSDERGCINPKMLKEVMNETVAAIMLTNPNTLGLFEEDILEICNIMHERGGLVYMDGANMNAFMGIARPGDMGIDVIHLNLHKSFSTPHGGGGPGSGPVAVGEKLTPFLPAPLVEENDKGYYLDYNKQKSIGRVRSFYGNFGVLIKAYAYILTMGADGLKQAAQAAVINANYIRKKLEGIFDIPYNRVCMHEVIFSDKIQEKNGISTLDIAKRLMDYGFHPPTIYFPLIVHGALMVEPTDTESRQEIDGFIEAMKNIAKEAKEDPDLLHSAPHNTKVGRLDEVRAARSPILRWTPKE